MDCSKCLHQCKAMCCGVVPISKDIFAKNKDKLNKNRPIIEEIDLGDSLIPLTKTGTCPFLTDDYKCGIYNDRPEVCRKFGDETHPMLICPYQSKDGRVRSRQERRQLERVNGKLIDKAVNFN